MNEVKLSDCPIGLFVSSQGELCVKTEYNTDGRIDAYIVSSGEAFWGNHPQTPENQRNELVTPISTDTLKINLITSNRDLDPLDYHILFDKYSDLCEAAGVDCNNFLRVPLEDHDVIVEKIKDLKEKAWRYDDLS